MLADAPVPAEIPGASASEQRGRYAGLLAAQVRLSFPTAVLADMVRTGAAQVRGGTEVEAGVYDFLTANQGRFEIGVEPVDAYLARANLRKTASGPLLDQLKRLQRVYQITPDDQALTVLLRHDMDSAYHITLHDQSAFVRAFAAEMGGEATATLTYRKAQQVHGAVLDVVTSLPPCPAGARRSAPPTWHRSSTRA